MVAVTATGLVGGMQRVDLARQELRRSDIGYPWTP